jgi:hypothetical protein
VELNVHILAGEAGVWDDVAGPFGAGRGDRTRSGGGGQFREAHASVRAQAKASIALGFCSIGGSGALSQRRVRGGERELCRVVSCRRAAVARAKDF